MNDKTYWLVFAAWTLAITMCATAVPARAAPSVNVAALEVS